MDKQQLVTDKENIYGKLEKDVKMLNNIFTDLNYMINEQGEYLDSIEANISTSKQDVEIAHTDIVESNQIIHSGVLANIKNLKFSSVGAGLGAIMFIYNPYLAIGTMVIGGFIGWNISDKLNTNSLDKYINKIE